MKKRSSVVAIKTVTSRPVLFLWSIVSILVALLCCWSYSQPAWTLRSSSEIGSLDQQHQQPADLLSSAPVTAAGAGAGSSATVRRRLERAVSIQVPAYDDIHLMADDDDDDGQVNSTSSSEMMMMMPGRSAIPLVHIGLFGMCIYTRQQPEKRRPESSVTCVGHADLDYEWLPPAWEVTRVLCGGGCVMLLACAAASVAVAFIRHHHRQQEWIKITAIVQLAAASLMLLGLCFYPFGLRSENLHHFCDERCQPGWSSLVAGLSSAAAFLCPVLATLVSNPIYDLNPWEAYLLL
ncbi:uncharacterized protein LOC124336369 [Daphnia pulicaria]|uniref:uncharacterized protein LOC124336369 n=1 Tax=Daphnia pulicaria TaxID=35523 RepID=UPI001EE9B0B7|nr:uncharacterized protein LOC124336369 [Daphnia pulicaria]